MANTNSIDVRPQQKVPRPKIRWENGSYTMDQILRKLYLPNVVQCDSVMSDVSREQSNFDFVQPMLLYSKRLCMKVIGYSLDLNKTTKSANEVGNQLLVPEDYKGWFAVLNPKKVNASVPHYAQVELLSQSDCNTFLIGGTENVEAVQKLKGERGPVARILYPGEVLKMGNTYVASTKVRNSMFGRPQVKETKFLLCIDQHDMEVLLPFQSKGLFYIITNKQKRPPIKIMQIKDIINNVQLPCVVKLLFGLAPSTPCTFTGLMVLKQSFEESSAIASSIVNLRNILLEIPSDIPIKFKVATDTNNIEDNVGFRNAFRLCQEKADTYMRNIKVSQELVSADIDIPEIVAPPRPVEHARDIQEETHQRHHGNEAKGYLHPHPHGKQFQFPPHPAFQRKEDQPPTARTQPLQSPGFHGNVAPRPLISPKVLENPPPSSAQEQPQSPPAPPRPPKYLSLVDTSAPSPPPQSAKPGLLDRVVSPASAPPSMIPPSKREAQPQPSVVGFHGMLAKVVGQQQPSNSNSNSQAWLAKPFGQSQPPNVSSHGVLAKPPAKKAPPETPPKPSGDKSISRHKPLRISVNNTYLTVPIYITPQYDDSLDSDDETVTNKMNFWKNLDRHSRDIATREAGKPESPKQEPRNISTPDSGQREVGGRTRGRTVYENIDDLKAFTTKPRKPSLDASDGDSTSDDVTYELPSFQRDDVVYEDPDFIRPEASQRMTNEEPGWIRPRKDLRSQRPQVDSGINLGEEEENDVTTSEVARMTGPEVYDRLKAAGLKKETVELLKKSKVDGRFLASHNEESLKLAFPKLTNIETRKIGLFMKGLKHI